MYTYVCMYIHVTSLFDHPCHIFRPDDVNTYMSVKRDLWVSKETYVCQKRPMSVNLEGRGLRKRISLAADGPDCGMWERVSECESLCVCVCLCMCVCVCVCVDSMCTWVCARMCVRARCVHVCACARARVCVRGISLSLLSVWVNDNTCVSKDEEGMLFDYKVSRSN